MFAPLPAAKIHSVRYPNKSIPEVMQRMDDNYEINQDINDPDSVQKINNELLQIINDGINQIVMQLKNRLGNNYEESNQNAIAIKHMLNSLQTQIETDIGFIGLPASPNTQRIERAINTNIFSETPHIEKPRTDAIDHDSVDISSLDDAYTTIFNDNGTIQNNLDIENRNGRTVEANDTELITRLLNCQNLEFLYLKKHDELMKVFAFIMNLFDKYKYAIKIILFLLKNLVNKDPPDGTTPRKTVQLPITIIKNIKKLVEDQETIQGVVNKMDAAIIKTDSGLATNLGLSQNTIDTIPILAKATSNFNDGNIATPPVKDSDLNA
jgi:hypothetical protein